MTLAVQGEPAGTRIGIGAGQRGAGVCLGILRGLAQPHADLQGDADLCASALGKRGDAEPSVAPDREPRVAATRKQSPPAGLSVALIRCASCSSRRCTTSRSSSRGCRADDRRGVSRSAGTSMTATASCASSSRRWVPSKVAVRRAEPIALRVDRTTKAGMS